MITYVVCKASNDRFYNIAYPPLRLQQTKFGAELIVVQDAGSIFRAYEQGRRAASHDVIVYLHDDAVLLDPDATPKLARAFASDLRLGLVGVLGSVESEVLPWWTNMNALGHSFYPRLSLIRRRPIQGLSTYVYADKAGNLRTTTLHVQKPTVETWTALPGHAKWQYSATAKLIDGVLIAERRNNIPWDTTTYVGWHAYDADRSLQVLAAGYTVAVCDLLLHHRPGMHNQAWVKNHTDNIRIACQKWGLTTSTMVRRRLRRLYQLRNGSPTAKPLPRAEDAHR